MRPIVFLLFISAFVACGQKGTAVLSTENTENQAAKKKVLVYTRTLGWRHKSIEAGVTTFRELGKKHNIDVHHTEDASAFAKPNLKQYATIIFLNTTGDILNKQQQEAFEGYIQNGGTFLGIHAAADTEYDWLWYGQLVGGYFESHPNNPNIREATLKRAKAPHPATAHYADTFKRADEWYNYKQMNPAVTPVLFLDESSYEGGNQGDKHAIAWYNYFDGGRAFYTGGGHTKESYVEPGFRKHLEEALLWCLK